MFKSIKIYKDEEVDYNSLARELVEYGYERRKGISESGDFSMRGGIIDIFPPTFEGPVRIELSGNKVKSIRSFSILSNETIEEHAMVIILPKLGLYPKKKRFKGLETGERRPLETFIDVQLNDYVVHVEHGIGVFSGFEKVEFKGDKKDHIVIKYADGDKLYVPIEEMHLIQKYLGFEKRPPKIYKLGSNVWKRVKEKVKEGINSMAFELLDLEAKRSKLDGFSFSKDTQWQEEFEKKFPFKETPDQMRSWLEVKKDMELTMPMDRLLCGDVGYGKTEVALRAAFKAVMDNKQVVILVPTTLLAKQHLITFRNRMEDFPVKVEMLSRFRTRGESEHILKEVKDGLIDIVIGTHAILRKNVKFKDLGLIIIDEEQRFGVKDKEKLKKIHLLVDIMTLTASPIPRTLYMSLMGIKDMSIIQTPPQDRLPVDIVVSEYDKDLVKRAILREKKEAGRYFSYIIGSMVLKK